MGVRVYIYCMFTHAFCVCLYVCVGGCGWYFHNVNICALSWTQKGCYQFDHTVSESVGLILYG